jgi:hypothetical protein
VGRHGADQPVPADGAAAGSEPSEAERAALEEIATEICYIDIDILDLTIERQQWAAKVRQLVQGAFELGRGVGIAEVRRAVEQERDRRIAEWERD